MHVFRAGHLASGNQLVYSSLGKTTSPTPSSTWLPVVFCVVLRLRGFFPIQFGLFIGVLVQLTFGRSCW